MENKPFINPIELDGDTVFVPVFDDSIVIDKDIIERRIAHGRVRWYERSLGYGFIREDGNSAELFVHQTSIQVPGIKYLRKGQRVIFEYCKTTKGESAINVIPVKERPDKLAKYQEKLQKQAETQNTVSEN